LGKKKIIIISFLGLALLSVIFIPGYLRIKNLNSQNRQLEQKIEEIRQANLRLEEEQQRLINDPIYLEKVAREKLGVVRKGEVVYKVLP
jgi:cell division protein DivIC